MIILFLFQAGISGAEVRYLKLPRVEEEKAARRIQAAVRGYTMRESVFTSQLFEEQVSSTVIIQGTMSNFTNSDPNWSCPPQRYKVQREAFKHVFMFESLRCVKMLVRIWIGL